jgi:hypothetical protein
VVDRGFAADWLERQLGQPTPPGVLTVVWHSITRMYWTEEESRRVDALIGAARGPVARVAMEYPEVDGGEGPEVAVWLPGEPTARVLAQAGDHGTPVRLVSS